MIFVLVAFMTSFALMPWFGWGAWIVFLVASNLWALSSLIFVHAQLQEMQERGGAISARMEHIEKQAQVEHEISTPGSTGRPN